MEKPSSSRKLIKTRKGHNVVLRSLSLLQRRGFIRVVDVEHLYASSLRWVDSLACIQPEGGEVYLSMQPSNAWCLLAHNKARQVQVLGELNHLIAADSSSASSLRWWRWWEAKDSQAESG